MSPTKRKAAALASGGDTPDSKRRRLPSATARETPETVQEAGSALLTQLGEARDKKNRSIVTHFLTLPDKDGFPDYYEVIALPLALDTIQGKLNRLEYSNLSAVEGDLKRLISNAKQYNERGSEIHSDAEKVRKMVATSMQKINPAYEDPSYVPVPTPLPDEVEEEEEAVPDDASDGLPNGADEGGKQTARQRLTLRGPSEKSQAPSEPQSHASTEVKLGPSDPSFEGKTFQAAQEAIVQALMGYEDQDGLNIATPFLNLPPRDLKDYYSVIKRPVSLKAVLKQVRGIKGREKPIGASFFKYWQSFEEEIRHIWNNARTFNEDESEITQYANELEMYFNGLLSKAKRAVQGPAPPHIKLHLGAKDPEPSPKIKLSFGSKAAPAGANGIAVDPDALQRQNEMVRAGINGTAAGGPNGTQPSKTAQPKAASPGSGQGVDAARSHSSDPKALKRDGSTPAAITSPAEHATANAAREGSDASAPAPGAEQRAASTSMPPPAARSLRSHSPQPPAQPIRQPLPPDQFQPRRRELGKGVESALIQEAVLYPVPDPSGPPSKKMRVLPNPHITHNGLHTYLDRRHTYFVLEVRPLRADAGRMHTVSVHVDDAPVQQAQRPPPGVEATGPTWTLNLDPNYPVTHRVHVLCTASVGRGPGMGTVEDRELRWFHIDYWP